MLLTISSPGCRATLLLMCAALFGVAACTEPPQEPLPMSVALTESIKDGSLANRVTVSGVSSGGYMAVQAHVALADRIGGVAAIAGGPYHCAENSVTTAIGRCMSGTALDVSGLVAFTKEAAEAGRIANPDSLKRANVWVFHSPEDAVVAEGVSVGLVDFYSQFVPERQIRFVDDVEAAHGWPTLDAGEECLQQGGDYINACDFDAAGELLEHLYGDLSPPSAGAAEGELVAVDMSPYFKSGSGVAKTGYAYVPHTCTATTQTCRLHIAFHGCVQGAEFVDDRFAVNVGLNEWAAANRIVVAYPQVKSSLMNPKGCWDWWGYTGSDYDQIDGKQISGVKALIAAFGDEGFPPAF